MNNVTAQDIISLAKKLIVFGMLKGQGHYGWVDKKVVVSRGGAGPFDSTEGINIHLQNKSTSGQDNIVFWSIKENDAYEVYMYKPGAWVQYLQKLVSELDNEFTSAVDDTDFFSS